ncbi:MULTISPECIES: AGE family epimerase/isomerase [unclassified Paenibacillus]|uniref:AGE family epimerase/isomerase n=1 Tax=unclassified Paenibacillus TaxID=185978 RepID=UPI001AE8A220|nr:MULTISPECIES: AGE family epimerase/isomerase [unclassified Paenibacillus]MBP1157315.1 mannose/cellobiose epimerase-like protein (N-acyl-D-glucosamine 2-epimerase family) [Paenibacillus sp. PvP091]MBP1171946.1 mannose/cellobiose epimerase-like protein (N-acyl-D-glucosamine 2-epimerase family) [Paenibacillus sp. PvR098]MBP2438327.1 mannose/cellobiose epimerase-like protein (N-acyl-D-glucosamine 2-epimerase family) [Paenibacillus sp. PvP052]
MNNLNFTFSDLVAGYVTSTDWSANKFKLKTTDGREYEIELTSTTYGELVRNFGEPYLDRTGQMQELIQAGSYLFAYGVFYPESGSTRLEAKHLVFNGKQGSEFRFEERDWWVQQLQNLADFYLRSQFEGGEINYRNYRTALTLEGKKINNTNRQETDTISRLVYGFASAYMLTGDERFLEAAEKGTEYLRDHMRNVDTRENIVYWYHGIDVNGYDDKKILASEFGDDYHAIPMYEQIYALAGPTQTFRITGDSRILDDIEKTIHLFEKFFLDKEKGGYFSHIDPVTFNPRSESLDKNRARKNWNSVGDHAPAYLINLCLALNDDKFKEMLAYTADMIQQHFPDYENSPFVNERFHEDWSHDQEWSWQQNRAVVGHNLKIAWNLLRIHHVHPNGDYVTFAEQIAQIMPKVGADLQRGGWYDVMERSLSEGQEKHRFVWHDRKAWWQQEQAILAYLIMAGSLGNSEYLKLARESSSFYNAWFLDHDAGGVYFNVLANGLPYLLGNERQKGSHSMSGYHSFELAYLASVYTNLLITKQPMDFYFKPKPGAFRDQVLRVQPDYLPPGSIAISAVWIDGESYMDYDAEALTVKLPDLKKPVSVKVRIEPKK